MEEKQINKWLRRRFSAVGWALGLSDAEIAQMMD